MEARTQRLEQAVFGVGTGNGLYREVKATREDVGKLAEKIDRESDERKAEWAEFYRRAFLGLIGLGGTFLVGFLISRLP